MLSKSVSIRNVENATYFLYQDKELCKLARFTLTRRHTESRKEGIGEEGSNGVLYRPDLCKKEKSY